MTYLEAQDAMCDGIKVRMNRLLSDCDYGLTSEEWKVGETGIFTIEQVGRDGPEEFVVLREFQPKYRWPVEAVVKVG